MQEALLGFETTLKRVSETLESGFDAAGACLCHGPLSCAESLLVAGRVLDVPRYRAAADEVAAAAAFSWQTAPAWKERDSPGLMTGWAGLGYFLLRVTGYNAPSLLLPLAENLTAGRPRR